jgi:hypothetical protein
VSVGVNGFAEMAAHIESGAVRALAISSAERLSGLPVPTLREQGIDVVFENWRSVAAPPGITAGDRRRLETLVEQMVRSREWRGALGRYRWLDRYLAGEAFVRYLESEERRVRRILGELGTAGEERSVWTSAGPYPLFVLAGLAACAMAAMIERRRSREHDATRAPASTPVLLIAAAGAAHLLLAESAGFVIAAAVLFWLTARAFDARHPLRDALFAIGLSVAAYLLFARALDLTLPRGVLEGWL